MSRLFSSCMGKKAKETSEEMTMPHSRVKQRTTKMEYNGFDYIVCTLKD